MVEERQQEVGSASTCRVRGLSAQNEDQQGSGEKAAGSAKLAAYRLAYPIAICCHLPPPVLALSSVRRRTNTRWGELRRVNMPSRQGEKGSVNKGYSARRLDCCAAISELVPRLLCVAVLPKPRVRNNVCTEVFV